MEFDGTVESVEMTEVAEPSLETVSDLDAEAERGVEGQEVTEPVSKKTDADVAFANMRRQNAELLRQLNEQKRVNEAQDRALGLYFQGDDKVAQAIAHYEQRSVNDVRNELQARTELEALRAESERYKSEAIEARATMQMENDLKAVQALDPNIKSLDDLGMGFVNMRLKGGLSVEESYFATMALKEKTERKPAQPAGKVQTGKSEVKDFLTFDEVKAHENDAVWIGKNYDLIMKSMPKW